MKSNIGTLKVKKTSSHRQSSKRGKTNLKKRLGGKLLNKGAYGCVFSPPLICSKDTNSSAIYNTNVSKLMLKKNAISEKYISSIIRKIPFNEAYFVTIATSCDFGTHQQNANIGKCNVAKRPANTLELLISEFSGNAFNKKLIQQVKTIPVTRIFNKDSFLSFVIHILEAVALMTFYGIVHRDLHAGNILVDVKGVPRIIDFNLSVLVQHITYQNAIKKLLVGSDLFNNYQISPEFIILNSIANNKSEPVIIEKMLQSGMMYTYMTFFNLQLSEISASLKNIYKDVINTVPVPNNETVQKQYLKHYTKQDVWAVGHIFMYILNTDSELKSELEQFDTVSHIPSVWNNLVNIVIPEIGMLDPRYRMTAVDALKMLSPESRVLEHINSEMLK